MIRYYMKDKLPLTGEIMRLLKMRFAIRAFALIVAFAGLASASLSSANTQGVSSRLSMTANAPGPLSLPGPLPCQANGTCPSPSGDLR